MQRVPLVSHRNTLHDQKSFVAFLALGTQQESVIREVSNAASDFLATVRALHWLECAARSQLGIFAATQSRGSHAVGTVKTCRSQIHHM